MAKDQCTAPTWACSDRSALPLLIMACGSRNDTVATTSRRSRTVVGLTLQHTNREVLVEGPEITIRPVGTRRLMAGGSR